MLKGAGFLINSRHKGRIRSGLPRRRLCVRRSTSTGISDPLHPKYAACGTSASRFRMTCTAALRARRAAPYRPQALGPPCASQITKRTPQRLRRTSLHTNAIQNGPSSDARQRVPRPRPPGILNPDWSPHHHRRAIMASSCSYDTSLPWTCWRVPTGFRQIEVGLGGHARVEVE